MDMRNAPQFEKIYTDLVDEVYRYTRFKLGNQAEAEDATSETFLRLANKGNLNEIQNLKFYVFGIARHVIYDIYRRPEPVGDVEEMDLPDTDLSIENKLIDEELMTILKNKLAELPDVDREIISLRVWEELSFGEIAELMGAKEGTVKQRFYRAVEKLTVDLKEDRKMRVMALPVLLGAIYAYSTDPIFAVQPNLINKLLYLLRTQYMDNANSTASVAPDTSVSSANATSVKTGLALSTPQIIAATAVVAIVGTLAAMSAVSSLNSGDTLPTSQTSFSSTPVSSVSIETNSTPSTNTANSSAASSNASLTKACSNLGYTFYVPANWVCTKVSDVLTTASGDGLEITLSNLGRDGYCNIGETPDCKHYTYSTPNGASFIVEGDNQRWDILFSLGPDQTYLGIMPTAQSSKLPTTEQLELIKLIIDKTEN